MGRAIAGVRMAFTALESVHQPLDALLGLQVEAVNRRGKHLDVEAQGLHPCSTSDAPDGWCGTSPRHGRRGGLPPRSGQGPLALRVLRDQRALAGIGNAWSDEILFAARMSPHQPASGLDAAGRARLYDAIRVTLGDAVQRLDGLEPRDLKDAKRSAMAVHGRTGEPCLVCGTPVAEVSFADSSLQYCYHCQTGGRVLADRRMSRLLK